MLKNLAYPGHVNLANHSLARFYVLQVFRQVNAPPLAAGVGFDDVSFRPSQFSVAHRLPVARNCQHFVHEPRLFIHAMETEATRASYSAGKHQVFGKKL